MGYLKYSPGSWSAHGPFDDIDYRVIGAEYKSRDAGSVTWWKTEEVPPFAVLMKSQERI